MQYILATLDGPAQIDGYSLWYEPPPGPYIEETHIDVSLRWRGEPKVSGRHALAALRYGWGSRLVSGGVLGPGDTMSLSYEADAPIVGLRGRIDRATGTP